MKRQKKQAISIWRFRLVLAVLCSLLALLVGRILSLQILDTERGHAFLGGNGERVLGGVMTGGFPTTKYALDGTAGTQDCSLAAADGLTGVCIIEDIADTSFTAQVSYICAQ